MRGGIGVIGLFDHGTWFGVPDYVAYPEVLALVLVGGRNPRSSVAAPPSSGQHRSDRDGPHVSTLSGALSCDRR